MYFWIILFHSKLQVFIFALFKLWIFLPSFTNIPYLFLSCYYFDWTDKLIILRLFHNNCSIVQSSYIPSYQLNTKVLCSTSLILSFGMIHLSDLLFSALHANFLFLFILFLKSRYLVFFSWLENLIGNLRVSIYLSCRYQLLFE